MASVRKATQRIANELATRPNAVIALVYGLAWWPHLVLFGGRFWDDWILYNTSFEHLVGYYSVTGRPALAFIHWPLIQWPPAYAMFGFTLMGLSGIVWFQILKRTPGVSQGAALIATTLSVVAPTFLARFALIQLPSIIGLIFFLLAWRVAVSGPGSFSWRKVFLFANLLLVAIVLYPAFATLALALLFHLLWIAKNSTTGRLTMKMFLLYTSAVFTVIVGFFSIEYSFLQPSGAYENYNQIILSRGLFVYALLTIFFLGFGVWAIKLSDGAKAVWVNALRLASFSALLFLLATGPYAAIGDFPPYASWQTRFEINYFLFISAAISAIVILLQRLPGNRTIGYFAVSLALGLLIIESNLAGIRFLSHWGKAQAIVSHVAENKSRYEGHFIVVVDRAAGLKGFGPGAAFYEWTGFIAEGTGSNTSLAIQARSSSGADVNDIYQSYLEGSQNWRIDIVYNYHWAEHVQDSPLLIMEVSPIGGLPTWQNRLNCAFAPFSDCVTIEFSQPEQANGN